MIDMQDLKSLATKIKCRMCSEVNFGVKLSK